MTARIARVAGVSYLLIIVCGIYAEFFVRSALIAPGDAAATLQNIAGSELMFRSAIGSEFIMLICDVIVAMALYVIFAGVHRSVALLMTFFRMVHAAIVGANLLNLFVPLLLLRDGPALAGLAADQREALTMLALQAHSHGYVVGLVFFGVQCLLLGYLILTSTLVPRLLGALMIVAGTGYLVDGFARTMLSNYADHEALFAAVVFGPAFIGALSLAMWLTVKGVKS
jgi:hypothetical protein